MTSRPAEPDENPQVVPSGDPAPDGDGPGTEPGHVPLGPQETNPDEGPDVPLDSARESGAELEAAL